MKNFEWGAKPLSDQGDFEIARSTCVDHGGLADNEEFVGNPKSIFEIIKPKVKNEGQNDKRKEFECAKNNFAQTGASKKVRAEHGEKIN